MNERTRICPRCNKEVEYGTVGHRNDAEKHNRICRKCQYKTQKHNPNTQCYICHKPIYRTPGRLAGGILFCSYGCRNKYYSKENSFAWKGGKIATQNRGRKRAKCRKLEKKQKAVELLGGKCNICGYNKCIAALDFHHLDPMTKDATLKEMWIKTWKYIDVEIKKCQLLCSNCHRELHWKETHE